MITIGSHTLSSRVLLAPMAGVSDLPFRQLCQRYGAGLTTAEMLTADSRLWDSRKSQQRLVTDNNSALPNSMQIVGFDPSMLADAASKAVDLGAEIIDINMGCPAKKVCKKAAGSALLRDEALVNTILQRVVASVAGSQIPVTLKIRTGWDAAQRNAVTIGRIAEDAGIQSLVIHGRTRACRFNGTAEYDSIAEVKAKLGINVIANGDIVSPEQALAVLKHTGADGIMVGRGAQGSPWLIQQINQAIAGIAITEPSDTEKQEQIIWHITALHQFYGDYLGLRIARKHTGWYFDKLGLSALKKAFNSFDSCEQQLTYLHQLSLPE